MRVELSLDDNPGADDGILWDVFSVPSKERISRLLSLELIKDFRTKAANDDKAKYLGLYTTTEKGKAVIVDYKTSNKVEHRSFILRSILVPIFISIITNFVFRLFFNH